MATTSVAVDYDEFVGHMQCPKCSAYLLAGNHLAGCPIVPQANEEAKLSNPKDVIGSDKVPLSIVPDTTLTYLALGHLEGLLKYGAYNWRDAGVRTSIYLDALGRHIAKFKNGEWADSKTNIPHLANALACLSILVDAHACGKLTDDRPKSAPVSELIDASSDIVKHLKHMFKEYNPKHYTLNNLED